MDRGYRIVVWTDQVGNGESCELQKLEDDGLRTVVKWICGPFDPPEDFVMQAREMIEQVGWQAQISQGLGSGA